MNTLDLARKTDTLAYVEVDMAYVVALLAGIACGAPNTIGCTSSTGMAPAPKVPYSADMEEASLVIVALFETVFEGN